MILDLNEPDAEIRVFLLDKGVLVTAYWTAGNEEEASIGVAADSLENALRLVGEGLGKT